MTGGYTGKILRLNLTTKTASTIDTAQYEEYGGGMGIGSAIFWDLAVEPGDWDLLDGYDPRNVVTVMTSPLSGTAAPAVAGRCEVNGIGVQGYPIGWFTRANFGGRFAGQLKYAGWDGIVIEGAASEPVWVNIVNDQVTFEDATDLWGLNTQEAQEDVWRKVTSNGKFGEWLAVDNSNTTQRPAVLCIGQAGENLSRIACLMHDQNSAGQGGFGGIWGAKKLKAISVIGTGSISVSDPEALMEARLWYNQNFQFNVDDPRVECGVPDFGFYGFVNFSPGQGHIYVNSESGQFRPQACQGCGYACRRRLDNGVGNESSCVEALWYSTDRTRDTMRATDSIQFYGLNAYQIRHCSYLRELYKMDILGPGKQIESDLPFEKYGSVEFAEMYTKEVAFRQGFVGDGMAEGIARFAESIGRYDEDTDSGLLALPQWGYTEHYDPRLEVEWSYGSLMGDRDINEHGFNWCVKWMPQITGMAGVEPYVTAEELVNILSTKTIPYTDDPYMWDYSEGPTGIYSDHRAKTIAFQRHYTRFWKQSIGYCDWIWPLYITPNSPDQKGPTPEGEPKFFNAVTGKNITFADGMETGRKIWNMHRAIWVLQGRNRDMEFHTGYVYTKPTSSAYLLPVYENGAWKYDECIGRVLNRTKFDEWKTKFYTLEGWDTSNGWPTRATLEGLGLGFVADRLQAAGKLGS